MAPIEIVSMTSSVFGGVFDLEIMVGMTLSVFYKTLQTICMRLLACLCFIIMFVEYS